MLRISRAAPALSFGYADGVGAGAILSASRVGRHVGPFTSVKSEATRHPMCRSIGSRPWIAAAQVATLEFHPWNCAPGARKSPGDWSSIWIRRRMCHSKQSSAGALESAIDSNGRPRVFCKPRGARGWLS